jgi:chromosomal replication initiator protein
MMSVSSEATSLWQRALHNARLRSPASFDQWFSSVQFDGLQDGVLGLTARDEFVRDWVKTHFLPAMLGDLEQLLGVDSHQAIKVDWRISNQLSEPCGTPPSSRARPYDDSIARHDIRRLGEDTLRGGLGRNNLRDGNLRDGNFRDGNFRDGSFREGSFREGSFRERPPVAIGAGDHLREAAPRDARNDAPARDGVGRDGFGRDGSGRSSERPPSSMRLVAPVTTDPLNPKHTFLNFVVGPSNELAYAAAVGSAGGGGPRYNPLFICGGTGLGKTHLMHSIAHRLLEDRPNACVLYLSAERFTNEFIESLQHHRMEEFRARYRRGCDALLVDDIQFLAGREQTQEEFFHTFNALRDADKPIVVTSDKYPQELQRMPERLISRFTSGLVADVQTPALETRVAILRKKAALEGIPLDHDVAVLLAQQVKSNVRELEGTLIRLAAKSSLLGRSIDMAFAQAELAQVNPLKAEVSSVEDIQRAVCSHFSLSNAELISKDRHKSVAFARQVAMYLCRQRLKCSFPELGRAFGNRDHTTVMSACRRVESLRKQDPQVDAHLAAIEEKLASEG